MTFFVPEMLEKGMKECSKSSPRKQLSPTLKVAKLSDSIDAEDYLEVHYSNHSRDRDSKVEIKAKQATKVTDIHDISAITQIEGVQTIEPIQTEDILSASPHSQGEDVLEHVETITHIERVQNKRSSAGSRSSYVDDSLTQEEAQMLDNEADCFSWEDDKFLLEINEGSEGTGEQSNSDKGSPSFRNHVEDIGKSPKASAKDKGSKKGSKGEESTNGQSMVRSDSGSSLTATASNLSVKAMGLRNRLAESFKGIRADKESSNFDVEDVRPVTPTTLPSDDYGFPLNIFTKVCCRNHPWKTGTRKKNI